MREMGGKFLGCTGFEEWAGPGGLPGGWEKKGEKERGEGPGAGPMCMGRRGRSATQPLGCRRPLAAMLACAGATEKKRRRPGTHRQRAAVAGGGWGGSVARWASPGRPGGVFVLHAMPASGGNPSEVGGSGAHRETMAGGGEVVAGSWRRFGGSRPSSSALRSSLRSSSCCSRLLLLRRRPRTGDDGGGGLRRTWTTRRRSLEPEEYGELDGTEREGRERRGRARVCPSPSR
jgi:hypothetical protein